MTRGPKVQNWEVMDAVRASGSSLRDYEAVGLKRGWDNILDGIIDRKIEGKRKDLEARAKQLAGKSR